MVRGLHSEETTYAEHPTLARGSSIGDQLTTRGLPFYTNIPHGVKLQKYFILLIKNFVLIVVLIKLKIIYLHLSFFLIPHIKWPLKLPERLYFSFKLEQDLNPYYQTPNFTI